MASSRRRLQITDSNIPVQFSQIDSLKWSEEVRLGSYLIALSLRRQLKMDPWDEVFFRLAKALYLQLSSQELEALTQSYETGRGRNNENLLAAKITAKRFYDLYLSDVPVKFSKTGRLMTFISLDANFNLLTKPEAKAEKKFLSTAEVADIFMVHFSSVVRWIHSRRLKAQKVGKDWQVAEQDMVEFAKSFNSVAAHQKSRIRDIGLKLATYDPADGAKLRRNTLRRIRIILGDSKLYEEDIQIAITHKKGCTAHELQDHLKKYCDYGGDIPVAIKDGRIKATKKGRAWHVAFPEMILAIASLRNWTTFSNVIQSQVSFDTFAAYAKEGRFGEVRQNISGFNSIRNEMAARADEICALAKQEKLEEKRQIMRAMRRRQLEL